VAEKHPMAEAIRTEIIKIATEGDSKQDGTLTVDVLLRIVRVAKTGRDLLAAMVESPKNLASLVKRPQSPFGGYLGAAPMGDDDLEQMSGQMASPVFATAPMSENFGMTAMREIIAAAKNFNGNGTSPARLVEAIAIAKEKGLAGAVGSDAHRASEIGRAWVEVEDFAGRDDFIAALREGSIIGKLTGNYIHVLTRLDVLRKWWTRRRAKIGA